ncbi:YceI family protein [Amycolatopsis sp. NPDC054798]
MTEATAATRVVAGTELPAAGTWKVDPGHAEVGFVGRHFLLTKVRGRFTGVDATLEIGERIEDTTVRAVIEMATVDSGDQTRDDHLRSGDFFDVEQHPRATFESASVTAAGNKATMVGNLTIKDVSRPVTLAVEYLGHARDPWGNDRVVFSARGKINREDWGLVWNMVLESGGLLVSKEIELVLEVEAVRAT